MCWERSYEINPRECSWAVADGLDPGSQDPTHKLTLFQERQRPLSFCWGRKIQSGTQPLKGFRPLDEVTSVCLFHICYQRYRPNLSLLRIFGQR